MKGLKSGKVRDIYETDDPNELLIQVSDRVSAFDFVLNQTIPNKGELLNLMSYRWFDMMAVSYTHLTLPTIYSV